VPINSAFSVCCAKNSRDVLCGYLISEKNKRQIGDRTPTIRERGGNHTVEVLRFPRESVESDFFRGLLMGLIDVNVLDGVSPRGVP